MDSHFTNQLIYRYLELLNDAIRGEGWKHLFTLLRGLCPIYFFFKLIFVILPKPSFMLLLPIKIHLKHVKM